MRIGRAGRGRPLSQRQPRRTISAPSRSRASPTTRPAGRRTTRGATGDPLVEYSHVAGRALRPGRLARAQEPDAQRRRAPGVPDAPRTTAGTSRRAAGSPGRRSSTARPPSAPAAASSTTGSTRRRLRADAARRRRPPAGPGDPSTPAIPIRSAGGAPGGAAAEQVRAGRRPGHAEARAWRTSASDAAALADRRR